MTDEEKFNFAGICKADNGTEACAISMATEHYTYEALSIYLAEHTPFRQNVDRVISGENCLQIGIPSPEGNGWLEMTIECAGENDYAVTLVDEYNEKLVKRGNIVCAFFEDNGDFIIRVWSMCCEECSTENESFDFYFEKEQFDYVRRIND